MQKTYYSIIPAEVKYDPDLSPNAKLLFGEIASLCNERGYCWASNAYFADLYSVGKDSVSRWVSELVKKCFVETDLEAGGGRQICLGVSAKMPRGIGKNAAHNSKYNNKENMGSVPDPVTSEESDVSIVATDEEGTEVVPAAKRRGVRTEEKEIGKAARRIEIYFAKKAQEYTGKQVLVQGYTHIKDLLQSKKLKEEQLRGFIDEFFEEAPSDERAANIYICLAIRNINKRLMS